jgi:hypothetical protein
MKLAELKEQLKAENDLLEQQNEVHRLLAENERLRREQGLFLTPVASASPPAPISTPSPPLQTLSPRALVGGVGGITDILSLVGVNCATPWAPGAPPLATEPPTAVTLAGEGPLQPREASVGAAVRQYLHTLSVEDQTDVATAASSVPEMLAATPAAAAQKLPGPQLELERPEPEPEPELEPELEPEPELPEPPKLLELPEPPVPPEPPEQPEQLGPQPAGVGPRAARRRPELEPTSPRTKPVPASAPKRVLSLYERHREKIERRDQMKVDADRKRREDEDASMRQFAWSPPRKSLQRLAASGGADGVVWEEEKKLAAAKRQEGYLQALHQPKETAPAGASKPSPKKQTQGLTRWAAGKSVADRGLAWQAQAAKKIAEKKNELHAAEMAEVTGAPRLAELHKPGALRPAPSSGEGDGQSSLVWNARPSDMAEKAAARRAAGEEAHRRLYDGAKQQAAKREVARRQAEAAAEQPPPSPRGADPEAGAARLYEAAKQQGQRLAARQMEMERAESTQPDQARTDGFGRLSPTEWAQRYTDPPDDEQEDLVVEEFVLKPVDGEATGGGTSPRSREYDSTDAKVAAFMDSVATIETIERGAGEEASASRWRYKAVPLAKEGSPQPAAAPREEVEAARREALLLARGEEEAKYDRFAALADAASDVAKSPLTSPTPSNMSSERPAAGAVEDEEVRRAGDVAAFAELLAGTGVRPAVATDMATGLLAMGVGSALELAELPEAELRCVGLNVVQMRKLRGTLVAVLAMDGPGGWGGAGEASPAAVTALQSNAEDPAGVNSGGSDQLRQLRTQHEVEIHEGGEEFEVNEGHEEDEVEGGMPAGKTVLFPPGPLGLKVASNPAWGEMGTGDIRSLFATTVDGFNLVPGGLLRYRCMY